MNHIEIKDWYEHEHSPGIFIMFDKDHRIHWSFSGNELRRVYLENPDLFISGPIEVAIPEYLDQKLMDDLDNF